MVGGASPSPLAVLAGSLYGDQGSRWKHQHRCRLLISIGRHLITTIRPRRRVIKCKVEQL
jgi:hypothetical protein